MRNPFLQIAAAEIEYGNDGQFKKFEYLIKLEGGRYDVKRKPAAGFDPASMAEPDSTRVILSGAITHGGRAVGWFELMGDDSVVIRDVDKNPVSTHLYPGPPGPGK